MDSSSLASFSFRMPFVSSPSSEMRNKKTRMDFPSLYYDEDEDCLSVLLALFLVLSCRWHNCQLRKVSLECSVSGDTHRHLHFISQG